MALKVSLNVLSASSESFFASLRLAFRVMGNGTYREHLERGLQHNRKLLSALHATSRTAVRQ